MEFLWDIKACPERLLCVSEVSEKDRKPVSEKERENCAWRSATLYDASTGILFTAPRPAFGQLRESAYRNGIFRSPLVSESLTLIHTFQATGGGCLVFKSRLANCWEKNLTVFAMCVCRGLQ